MSAFTIVNQNQVGFDPAAIFSALFGGTTGITRGASGFEIRTGGPTYRARRVILATGQREEDREDGRGQREEGLRVRG